MLLLIKQTIYLVFSGSTFGLKLVVNVETYEYMPGPHSDAGIKVCH